MYLVKIPFKDISKSHFQEAIAEYSSLINPHWTVLGIHLEQGTFKRQEKLPCREIMVQDLNIYCENMNVTEHKR